MRPYKYERQGKWAPPWKKHVRGRRIPKHWRKQYNRMSGHAKHWYWHD